MPRGHATLGLACLLYQKGKFLEREGNDSGPAYQEAERLLDTVIETYGDCPSLFRIDGEHENANLADEARRKLFEIRHLTIGKPAPNIVGEDTHGEKLRLSDFRGRIVVLTFWATWCGPCMAMVPHERTLVERMKGKPFTLLGVNGDDDRNALKKSLDTHNITWRILLGRRAKWPDQRILERPVLADDLRD